MRSKLQKTIKAKQDTAKQRKKSKQSKQSSVQATKAKQSEASNGWFFCWEMITLRQMTISWKSKPGFMNVTLIRHAVSMLVKLNNLLVIQAVQRWASAVHDSAELTTTLRAILTELSALLNIICCWWRLSNALCHHCKFFRIARELPWWIVSSLCWSRQW